MDNYGNNFHSKRVDQHQFAMVPRSDIPRSKFRMAAQHKTTINAATLYPLLIREVLPGDTWSLKMSSFIRMQTPVFPIFDNMALESWFFFVPCRILWSHWVNFMGEQPASPADSISYTIPTIVSPIGGFANLSIYDYAGIPGVGQIAAGQTTVINALPFRAYNMIWNQWFRDQNLDTAVGFGATNTVFDIGDGPDPSTNYSLLRPRKRHDYFTAGLPFTQKGTAVALPLGTVAPVRFGATNYATTGFGMSMRLASGSNFATSNVLGVTGSGSATQSTAYIGATAPGAASGAVYIENAYADLSTATAATINQIRIAFQTQKLLERDARGGTRYQELLMAHFGVHPLDARLQRPEYLGGGMAPINISPVPQTGGTGATGTTSPLGTLSAVATGVVQGHGFSQSFTEHGYIIGLVTIRADQTYQQGLHRQWTRSTRYDFYWPEFCMLGEQAIRNDELYATGTPGQDGAAFAYQERFAEYRYMPSLITAAFRSTYTTPLDSWHLAQKYTALPALNSTFMAEALDTTLDRVLAGGASMRTNAEQFLCDFLFDATVTRPMPMYSVPGLLDHF